MNTTETITDNSMNGTMSYNLKDYIKVYKDFLSSSECKAVIKKLKKETWGSHSYYDARANSSYQYENELFVTSPINDPFFDEINNKLWNLISIYIGGLNFSHYTAWSGYSLIRFNRYDVGSEMRKHCDHIQSLFDGDRKGIPTLTILGSLNNNYKGGELLMFDEQITELKEGEVMIFPSNFLYPHQIKPVTKGTRYSFVSWVW